MATRSILLLPALAWACAAEAPGLGGPDGGSDLGRTELGVTDGGGSRDGSPEVGLRDAGAPRACRPVGARVELWAEGFLPDRIFEGRMRAVPAALDRLVDETGERWVSFGAILPVELSGTYWARVEIAQPFWQEVRVLLRTLGPDGAPGAAVLLAWSGASFGALSTDEIELAYRYEPEGCLVPEDACGRSEGLRLVAEGPDGTLRVGRGQGASAGDLWVVNGDSARFVDGPWCTDTPSRWHAGMVAVARGGCAVLGRDACIADPACTLWGSETLDPGYTCRLSAGDCERIADPEACAAIAGCAWDPGDCYCPEGMTCACGGGPAPKCRSACGTRAGFDCPEGRYCEEGFLEPPDCRLPPDGAGWCAWAPPDCAGTPSRPVCACTLDGPARFEDDCRRRQARAGRADPAACP